MDARRPGSKPTALVTGASSGIGYELARKFAGNGYDLVIVARNRQRLEDLAVLLHKDYGTNVVVLPKDLAAEPSAQEIVDYLKNEAIKIDILVNNAGFDVHGLFIDTDLERELQMIQVNLVTLTRLTKFLLPDMVEQGFGMVLNVGSIGSFVPSPLNAVYSATKAYVLSFSEAIAEELVGSGVSVTVLCPGTTRTEFQRRAGMQNVRLLRVGVMDAERVAEVGYRALMRGTRVAVPGRLYQLAVLLSKLVPRTLVLKAAKYALQLQ